MEIRQHQQHDLHAPHFQLLGIEEIEQVLVQLHDNANFTKLALYLQSRPAIASIVMNSANTALLAHKQKVESLRHALTFLGVERTRTVLSDVIHTLKLQSGKAKSNVSTS